MRMTIDRAVKKLKGQQADFNEQYIDFGGINDAFNTAYEVMHKYQEIERIIRNYDVAWEFHHMKSTIDKIREVIGDDK